MENVAVNQFVALCCHRQSFYSLNRFEWLVPDIGLRNPKSVGERV